MCAKLFGSTLLSMKIFCDTLSSRDQGGCEGNVSGIQPRTNFRLNFNWLSSKHSSNIKWCRPVDTRLMCFTWDACATMPARPFRVVETIFDDLKFGAYYVRLQRAGLEISQVKWDDNLLFATWRQQLYRISGVVYVPDQHFFRRVDIWQGVWVANVRRTILPCAFSVDPVKLYYTKGFRKNSGSVRI